MSRNKMRKLSKQVLDEAADWFVELNNGAHGEVTRERFDGWLRTSPEHMRAYLQIAAHWEEGVGRRAASLETVDELVAMARAERNVVRLAGSHAVSARDIEDDQKKPLPAETRSHKTRYLAMAASVLLLVLSGFAAWLHYARDTYATGIGEQRSLRLADGSTVELNSRTRVRVRYVEHERRIDLLEGQALFNVQKSAGRPFIVVSGDTRVLAVGTQFDVYRKASGTTVTVIEGRVAVSRGTQHKGAASSSGSLLSAGEQVVSTAMTLGHPKTADVAAAVAWKDRRLVFRNAPLLEVVEEFNRYNEVPIEIVDRTLEQTRISGSFSSSDPAALLRFLREVGAYKVSESDDAVRVTAK